MLFPLWLRPLFGSISGLWRSRVLALLLLGSVAVAPAWGQIRFRPRKPAAVAPSRAAKPVPADPPAVQAMLFQAANLTQRFKDSEALAIYQEILKASPNHYFSLWQAAVLSVKIGSRYSDETRKESYFDAARQYADRALLIQPEGGESNYAAALALFSQAPLYKAGARLKAFRDLRSYVYLAAEQRPDMPEAWHLLGRWQYRVAHYNLLERAYSKIVLGDVPDGGDSRKAMDNLEKARRLDPQNLQYCYDLARMCRYQGRRRRAIEVLREAKKIPPITSEDLVISRLCQQMLPPLLRADARRYKRSLREVAPAVKASPDSLKPAPGTVSQEK
jgi:tetratricopeptide (TPR) repeat protein